MFKTFQMKTKLILAAIILFAIAYSCSDREEQTNEQQDYLKKEKTINKGIEDNGATSKVSDTVKTTNQLDATNQTQIPAQLPAEQTGETVNPGSLGTPPTRP
jgi:hypothetical protein